MTKNDSCCVAFLGKGPQKAKLSNSKQEKTAGGPNWFGNLPWSRYTIERIGNGQWKYTISLEMEIEKRCSLVAPLKPERSTGPEHPATCSRQR